MLGAAGLLTLVTLLGLMAGLGREWLLVSSWGAGARTDGFLIALFIPEALRTILAGGVLSSAAMALWQERTEPERHAWLGHVTLGLTGLGLVLACVFSCVSTVWVHVLGPGMAESSRPSTEHALSLMAWALPPMLLQALWSVPLQAQGRFLLSGLGSLVYNLPVVAYLAFQRQQANETHLSIAFIVGAWATAMLMWPAARAQGLRWATLRWHGPTMRELAARAAPLLGSALIGQGMTLLERMVGSYMGEGVITVLNLARKLVNLPLVALMSINQVVLGLMTKGQHADRIPLLRQGLAINTLVTTPAALGLLLSAQAIVALLFPKVHGTALIGPLLGWYAVALIVAGWNTLLARYNHAAGNTRLPFICETSGNVVQAIFLPVLAWLWGVQGMAVALLMGVLVNGILLLHLNALWRQVKLPVLLMAGGLPLLMGAALLPFWPDAPLMRLLASTVAGALCLALLAWSLKPWRGVTA